MLVDDPSILFARDGTIMFMCRIIVSTLRNIAGGDPGIEKKKESVAAEKSGNVASDERIYASKINVLNSRHCELLYRQEIVHNDCARRL